MAKVRCIDTTKLNGEVRYEFYCPGCCQSHFFWTKGNVAWGFNGDVNKPTVSPSIKVEYNGADKNTICHSFIRNGFIEYLNDCTHSLAGKTIELEDL
jgi:hypothetical protein